MGAKHSGGPLVSPLKQENLARGRAKNGGELQAEEHCRMFSLGRGRDRPCLRPLRAAHLGGELPHGRPAAWRPRSRQGKLASTAGSPHAQSSLPRFNPAEMHRLNFSGELPVAMRIPPLKIKITIESNILKSRILVRRLAVLPIPEISIESFWANLKSVGGP